MNFMYVWIAFELGVDLIVPLMIYQIYDINLELYS